MQTIEAHLDGRQRRRMREEERFLDRLDRAEREASHLIGELCREGRTVYYINLKTRDGRFTGKTKEGSFSELLSYLVRNHYV